MTSHFPPSQHDDGLAPLVIEAARQWRRARDQALPHVPALSSRLGPAVLGQGEGALLSLVFDSLLHAYEAVIGRAMHVGGAGDQTDDERMLMRWIRSASQPMFPGPNGQLLQCALRSTRIMVASVFEETASASTPTLGATVPATAKRKNEGSTAAHVRRTGLQRLSY